MPVRQHNSRMDGSPFRGLYDLFSAFRARKALVIAPTLFICLASILYVQLLPSQYLGQAAILVEGKAGAEADVDSALQSLLVRLAMPDVAAKVIADLGLQRRAEFDPLLKGVGIRHSLLVGVGLMPDPRGLSRQDRVQNAYFERLAVERVGASHVINVGFRSQDGELAASIANRIAEEALRPVSAPPAATADSSADITRRLTQVEARIAAMREANTRDSSPNPAGNAEVSAAVRAQYAALQSRATLVREAVRLGRIAETPDVTTQDGVKKLLEQRAQIKGQITLDERTLPPTHPRMKEAYTQLNGLDSQLRMVADRVARGFENEARALAARTGLAGATSKTPDQSEREVQLAALEQEAQSLRDQLAAARPKSTPESANGTTGDAASTPVGKILTRASVQKTPVYPNKLAITSGATLAAFFTSLGLAFFLHLVSRRGETDAEDGVPPRFVHGVAANAEGDAQIPPSFQWARNPPHPHHAGVEGAGLAAPSPTNQNTRGTVLPGQGTPAPLPPMPVSPVMEHEEAVRQQVPPLRQGGSSLLAAEEIGRELNDMGYIGRGKVTIFYGMEVEARSSLHAMRLGRRMVKEGAALVVELFGQDNLYARVSGQNLAGLGAYLDGQASIAEIIHRDARSRLHILPAGEPLAQRIFGQKCQDQLEAMIHALCQSYAHVIIDAGPVGAAGEMVAELADAVVIVTQADEQNTSLTKAISRFEKKSGCPVFIVLDEFKALAADHKANAPRIVGLVRG